MKYLILLLLILLPHQVFAHDVLGYKPERTLQTIEKVTNYFQKKHNLTLQKNIVVYVTKTHKQYKQVLEKFTPNAKQLSSSSYAVSDKNGHILIDGNGLSDKHFSFILAHEITHCYQFENLSDPHSDYVQLEGQADILASRISDYYMDIQNHGIPYKKLRSREDFFRACQTNREKTIQQIRYYAQNVPFLSYPKN